MNPSTVVRNLITATAMATALAIVILWIWPTVAHAQSSTTTIRGAGLQPLVEERGSTQTLNIYGPGGVIIAQVATDSPAGGTPTTQTRYLLHDHLGSTRVVLDSNNQVLGSFDYSPFGETTPTGTVANVAYRYTGQEVNDGLGTYNYHARHYDAEMGRFLRVDPARYNSSPYVYANDNPINFVDQTGQQPIVWLVSRAITNDINMFKSLIELITLAEKLNIPNSLITLEGGNLRGSVPQSDFSLIFHTHGTPQGFEFLARGKFRGVLTPEETPLYAHEALIEEAVQPEALTTTLLSGCKSGCERNGSSLAERFFQHGLERFPNLERVIASPYAITIDAKDGRVQLEFSTPDLEGQPNRGISLKTNYDLQQFFAQNIDEAVLRANRSSLEYRQYNANSRLWEPLGEVPHHLQARTLSEHFREPLFRTYTRSQVEQRSTLRELPFFSEAELP